MTTPSTHRPPIEPPSPEAVAEAGRLLRAGALVGLPTETVYGLAADATQGEAVARIFKAKGRPRFNPLIVHAADHGQAQGLGRFSPAAMRLAEAFWPGPLTLVVPRAAESPVADLVTAGLETVALRVPDHAVARSVIKAAGRPLAAPSANPSGRVSPTTAEHVAQGLGPAVSLILDGGPCRVGLESTVVAVDATQVSLLRPGGVPRAHLEEVLGRPLDDPDRAAGEQGPEPARPASPGMLLKHYAPATPVRLEATHRAPGEAVLAFGPAPLAGDGPTINLSARGDLAEAAAHLFAALRSLDASGAPGIAVMQIPTDGLGEAITDRLRRAAAGSGECPAPGTRQKP